MSPRTAQREPLLPHEELAAQAAFPKPQYAGTGETIDTSQLRHRKEHPDRCPKYLRWLTKQSCVIAGKENQRTGVLHICWHPDQAGRSFIPSDPAHPDKSISGKLKVSDSDCMPLCRHAHREQEPNHDQFDRDYGIDRFAIADEHFARFEKETAR